MFSNRFTAVIDACVLADVTKRDLILTLAEAGLFRLCWSDEILRETEAALQYILRERDDARARATRSIAAMRTAFPEAECFGYEDIVGTLSCLTDPNDHHVLAVAIECKASVIVTDNIKDFPAAALTPYSIEARIADEFIADAIDLDYALSIKAIAAMRAKLSNPSLTAQDLIEKWRQRNMHQTVEAIFPHIHSI
ncbi:PIN domain-containing protein [Hyphomonas sp.]|uniref:PIN domain-containing protein n=1 Tax=Hyphomonas sp. TaxID=87 RepID=UPI001DC8E6FD|nr:PIN domain-containing protein [Hyphomonas sp.]MBU3920864.1 PIN domain-containing protein [Alphaproteobacteria bacterium]MBU4060787.1 PIN domain-containing protein [Alphaproteobacteria bacterium]MBU4164771.1 PIN domain-containing protein [Alphaproteobacteria bacterium]